LSNHVEFLAIREVSREFVWLRSIIQHVWQTCGLSLRKMNSTTIYEDNSACIAQLKEWYIKGNKIKHILPKFFFIHDLQRNGNVEIKKIRSCKNLAYLFAKSLLRRTFEYSVHKIGLHHLNHVCLHEGDEIEDVMNNIILKNIEGFTLFPSLGFISQRIFPSKVLTRYILISIETQQVVLWINDRPLIWYSYSYY